MEVARSARDEDALTRQSVDRHDAVCDCRGEDHVSGGVPREALDPASRRAATGRGARDERAISSGELHAHELVGVSREDFGARTQALGTPARATW